MLHNISLQLYLAAKLKPEMYDFIYPMGPKYSVGTRKVIAAQLMKSLSANIKNPEVKREIHGFSEQLYLKAIKEVNFDIDDICPRPLHIPIHFPSPWPGPMHNWPAYVELNPQPQPPEYYKAVLNMIAESMNDKTLQYDIETLAKKI
jgi:hypothetical protein